MLRHDCNFSPCLFTLRERFAQNLNEIRGPRPSAPSTHAERGASARVGASVCLFRRSFHLSGGKSRQVHILSNNFARFLLRAERFTISCGINTRAPVPSAAPERKKPSLSSRVFIPSAAKCVAAQSRSTGPTQSRASCLPCLFAFILFCSRSPARLAWPFLLRTFRSSVRRPSQMYLYRNRRKDVEVHISIAARRREFACDGQGARERKSFSQAEERQRQPACG